MTGVRAPAATVGTHLRGAHAAVTCRHGPPSNRFTLRALAQCVVAQHEGTHRFHHRDCPRQKARIWRPRACNSVSSPDHGHGRLWTKIVAVA